ncbi:hypothetical protein pb186bvf_010050 [Paramecium bursaria]
MQFLIDKKEQKKKTYYKEIGWTLSSLVLNPLDRIRRQLQISEVGTSIVKLQFVGSGQVIDLIYQQEGLMGFWKNFLYRIIKDVYLFNVYEIPESFKQMKLKNKYLPNILKTGSEYLLQIIFYPFDIIQARCEIDVGNKQFSGYFDCMIKTYREFGIGGFFVGLKVCTLKFIIYDLLIKLFREAYNQTIKYKYRHFIKHPQPIPYWKYYFVSKPTCSLICHPLETYRRLQIFNNNRTIKVSSRQLMLGYKELLLAETLFLFLKLLVKKIV